MSGLKMYLGDKKAPVRLFSLLYSKSAVVSWKNLVSILESTSSTNEAPCHPVSGLSQNDDMKIVPSEVLASSFRSAAARRVYGKTCTLPQSSLIPFQFFHDHRICLRHSFFKAWTHTTMKNNANFGVVHITFSYSP